MYTASLSLNISFQFTHVSIQLGMFNDQDLEVHKIHL